MRRLTLFAALWCGLLHGGTSLVLPFFNHTQSKNLDWIGESIAESIGDSLASEGLLTLNRADRLEAYRRLSLRPGAELTHASIIKIGQALDASSVIYGSYELSPNPSSPQSKGTLRITARILDLKHTHLGPDFVEPGPLEDLAAIEVRLGWQSLKQLDPATHLTLQDFTKDRPPVRIDAVENYIRGLLAASPEQRMRFFSAAARLDERYSPPAFQLAKIYWEKKDYKTSGTWFDRVTRFDPRYLEAQFFLGLCRFDTGDYAAAEHCFALVAEQVPLNEVWNNLGASQARQKKADAAGASFAKAIEGDSADPDYRFNLGFSQWHAGQYPAAVETLRAATERNANDQEATALLGRALKHDGPRAGDPRSENRERVKTNYEEEAYRQLQAELKK
jgi:tetratricopeptide (TPR) repeat protein